jgi:hypothetical protein
MLGKAQHYMNIGFGIALPSSTSSVGGGFETAGQLDESPRIHRKKDNIADGAAIV